MSFLTISNLITLAWLLPFLIPGLSVSAFPVGNATHHHGGANDVDKRASSVKLGIGEQPPENDFGTRRVELDDRTCASNGKDRICGDDPNTFLPIISGKPDSKETVTTWTFYSYPSGASWQDRAPLTGITCDVTLFSKTNHPVSTIRVYSDVPYVEEFDEKRFTKLDCKETPDGWVIHDDAAAW